MQIPVCTLPCAIVALAFLFQALSSLAGEQPAVTQWNYDVYRERHPEQVSRVRTSQSGKTSLEPVLEFHLEGQEPPKTPEELRLQLRQTWRDLLGPSQRNTGPLNARVLESTNFAAFERRKVEYEGDSGEPIRAWLFLPRLRPGGRAPAVICLHQTVRQGKDQAAGRDDEVENAEAPSPELAYGPLLAGRGYVTLCPDAICFGERYQVGGDFYCHYGDAVRIYQGNAGRSLLAKMADDVARALDYLGTLPEVDTNHFGSIGHSHGGYGTLFAMAFDDRIKAGVVSCGFTCFRPDPTPARWFRGTALLPRLGAFEGRMQDTPVDFHHLFAVIAPRALLLSVATQDAIFPGVGDMNWIGEDLRKVYARERAGGRFETYVFDGAHAFTAQARDRAWAFLDRHLKPAPPGPPLKKRSAFFPSEQLARVRANAARLPWGQKLREQAIREADHWLRLSNDELWNLIVGPAITRSWMVWSNGHCPACQKDVEMYRWIMEAKGHPWKVRCPHCAEYFPKNDFAAFHRSGLDARGVFDPKKADRALLFNAEHPAQDDPRRGFGVDDGEGYVEGDKRWRFIGAYLVYGQFKQAVKGGAQSLAAAFVLTGRAEYARKAGILLDRLADLYPEYNFKTQGRVYETAGHNGYVSTWHDACEETRELALAYDQVFEALRQDPELVAYMAGQAAAHGLDNPKRTFADIQRNIEDRLLRHPLAHPERIHSNFPTSDCTQAILATVLGWPDNRAEVLQRMDAMIPQATAVDGVTGEKGLAGYSVYTISRLAWFLGEYVRADPSFLGELLQRYPGLRQTWRFHIDTLCLGRYYPLSGDTGSLGQPMPVYGGAMPLPPGTSGTQGIMPSMFTFLWRLYEATGEVGYAQMMIKGNNGQVTADLPYDLWLEQPEALQQKAADILRQHGAEPAVDSVNLSQWQLAILRSGQGTNARAVWLDYDSGGRHGHADAMNLGLFARGLDLLPEYGYPAVQFGGWETPRARWFTRSAAHNTVVVDGRESVPAASQTTLWMRSNNFQAIRVSGPDLVGGQQYERTVCLVDLSPESFYVADIFRVVGGSEHARITHGPYAGLDTGRLAAKTPVPFGTDYQMRGFLADTNPPAGWQVTWKVQDRLKLLPPGAPPVFLRLWDATRGAQALVGETWLVGADTNGQRGEIWNPCLATLRRGAAPLQSTFVSVYEVHNGQPAVLAVRRLPLQTSSGAAYPEAHVALEIELADGRRDLLVAPDEENPLRQEPSMAQESAWVQPDWNVRGRGSLSWQRR